MRKQYRFIPSQIKEVYQDGYCQAKTCQQEKRIQKTH